MDVKHKALYEAKAPVLKGLAHFELSRNLPGENDAYVIPGRNRRRLLHVSRHVSVLKRAGILVDDKRGKQVFHCLKVPCVLNFMQRVEAVPRNRTHSRVEMLRGDTGTQVP